MSWRIVTITEPARLSVTHGNLQVKQDEIYTIPFEDIGVLMVETHQCSLSNAVLDACVQHRVVLLTCDHKHMPSGVLHGFHQHSRLRPVIEAQIQWSQPFKKRLWQCIIRAKIRNQSIVARSVTNQRDARFATYQKTVQSGDSMNREASASRLYFSAIFPDSVRRGDDHWINSALNYGYSIVRGCIARSLVTYGFMPAWGIHHRNELNAYALADDVIEPFRPYVDQYVLHRYGDGGNYDDTYNLSKEDRVYLLQVIMQPVVIAGQEYTMQRGIDIVCKSLKSATMDQDYQQLRVPEMV